MLMLKSLYKCLWSQMFHAEYEVKNYPLKKRTEKELEELRSVQNNRKLEMTACTVSNTQAWTVCGFDSN